jgi:hypothetical protein
MECIMQNFSKSALFVMVASASMLVGQIIHANTTNSSNLQSSGTKNAHNIVALTKQNNHGSGHTLAGQIASQITSQLDKTTRQAPPAMSATQKQITTQKQQEQKQSHAQQAFAQKRTISPSKRNDATAQKPTIVMKNTAASVTVSGKKPAGMITKTALSATPSSKKAPATARSNVTPVSPAKGSIASNVKLATESMTKPAAPTVPKPAMMATTASTEQMAAKSNQVARVASYYKSSITGEKPTISDVQMKVHAQPNAQSKVLTSIGVTENFSVEQGDWVRIKTKDGQIGWALISDVEKNINEAWNAEFQVIINGPTSKYSVTKVSPEERIKRQQKMREAQIARMQKLSKLWESDFFSFNDEGVSDKQSDQIQQLQQQVVALSDKLQSLQNQDNSKKTA